MRLAAINHDGTITDIERLNELGRAALAKHCRELLQSIGYSPDDPIVKVDRFPGPYVSLASLADMLKVDRKTVKRWMDEAGIGYRKDDGATGRKWCPVERVKAWMAYRKWEQKQSWKQD